MKILIVFVIALVSAVLFHEFVPDHSFIRIALGNHIIESNLWVMLSLIAIIIFALWVISFILRSIFSSHSPLNFWSKKAIQKRAVNKTQKGLIALVEGEWPEATKLLAHSAPRANTKLLNYLGAARAAGESGNEKEAAALLQKAFDSSPEAEFAIGITQAQVQLTQSQLEPCLATLIRLRKEKPTHKLVLKLLKVVYLKLEDWHQLSLLLPSLRKHKVLSLMQLEELEEQTWQNLVKQKFEEASRNEDSKTRSEDMTQIWKEVPQSLRDNERFIYLYCDSLNQLGDGGQAETLIRKTLKREWSDLLIELYGRITGQNTSEQLINAETWLKERPNNATLLLALGRLSLRNELWGKALEYFEASHAQQATQESYSELCRLAPLMQVDPDKQKDLLFGLINTIELPNLPLPSQR